MKQEKQRQQSIRRRIKSKVENTLLGIAIVGFVYCAFIRRSFSYGKKTKQKAD